jgi:hypothetical protein
VTKKRPAGQIRPSVLVNKAGDRQKQLVSFRKEVKPWEKLNNLSKVISCINGRTGLNTEFYWDPK